MPKPLTIGRVATLSGVNIETIRYYQRIGILREPDKPVEGYRVYPAETINRIRFIKRAQELGFSLKEINELLELGDGHCGDIMQRADQKRKQIQQQINDLSKLQQTLESLVNACKSDNSTAHCPIIDTLTAE